MKNIIFYFTSTGNSLAMAQTVAKGLKNTKLIGIPKALKSKTKLTAETIGIVIPVYCWGLPSIVVDFIRRANFSAKYVYAITTYGGCPGDTLLQLEKELKNKGIKLQSGFGLHLPGNYTPMYGAQAIKTQNKYFAKAKAQLPNIITTIKKQKTAKITWGPWPVSVLLRLTRFYQMFLTHVHASDKAFLVQANCNSCGICTKVCPVNNIKLKSKKPVWQHNCENCLACLQWCPQEAIQYGKSTIGKKRYHHPEIKLKDIFAQK